MPPGRTAKGDGAERNLVAAILRLDTHIEDPLACSALAELMELPLPAAFPP